MAWLKHRKEEMLSFIYRFPDAVIEKFITECQWHIVTTGKKKIPEKKIRIFLFFVFSGNSLCVVIWSLHMVDKEDEKLCIYCYFSVLRCERNWRRSKQINRKWKLELATIFEDKYEPVFFQWTPCPSDAVTPASAKKYWASVIKRQYTRW